MMVISKKAISHSTVLFVAALGVVAIVLSASLAHAQSRGGGGADGSGGADGAGGTAAAQVEHAADRVMVETEYDARGQVLRQSLPHYAGESVRWTEYRYDALGRKTSETHPDGKSATLDYLPGDVFSAVQVTDENGRTRQSHFDEFGNEIYRDRFDGETRMRTTYQYDVLNRLTGIIDPLGAQWSYAYDGHGNKVSELDPDLGCRQMSYDIANRLSEQRANDGALVSYSYDALDRVLTKTVNKDALQFSDCSSGNLPGNRFPQAFDDQVGILSPGAVGVLVVLANDTDPDGDTLSIVQINGVSIQPGEQVSLDEGVIILNQNQSLTFQSDPGASGAKSFTYTVSDGYLTATATVRLTISANSQGPFVANSIPDQAGIEDTAWSFTVPEDTFSDLNGNMLAYSASLADGSALPAWLSFDNATRTFSGTPPQDFNGTLSLKVVASGESGSGPVGGAPVVANPIPDQTSAEDAPWSFTVPANTFLDGDGDPLSYSASLADGSSLPAWLSFDGATRTFAGTPPQDLNGTFSFKVTASDGTDIGEDIFFLLVFAVNDAPVAMDDSGYSTYATEALTIPMETLFLNDSDPEGDILTIAAVADGSGGSVAIDGADVVFTPDILFSGDAEFTYTASDGSLTDSAMVTIEVTVPPVTPASQGFSSGGSFVVPYYNQITVDVRGAGGGAGGSAIQSGSNNDPSYSPGPDGGSGGTSSFNGVAAGGGGGGDGGSGWANGDCNCRGASGSNGGGSGGNVGNYTGGGASGGTAGNQKGNLEPGGHGGKGGRAVSTWTRGQTGAPEIGATISVQVGGGGSGSPGGNRGSVSISWQ